MEEQKDGSQRWHEEIGKSNNTVNAINRNEEI